MAGLERARAAWAAMLAAWQARYAGQAAQLAGLLADQATVPLDPFPGNGHRPCWCPCGTAHSDDDVCDAEAVTTRPAASAEMGTVDLPVCAPCWAATVARMNPLASRPAWAGRRSLPGWLRPCA